MSKTLIFDTEATDKNNPVIIEAAWLELASLEPFETTHPWVQRYNPGKPISLGALATHHILDEELVDCPPSNSFSLPEDTQYLIGHNVDFDWQAIGNPDIKRICTLALARSTWPNLDSHNQSALLYFLDRNHAKDMLKNAHSALADVEICAVILKHICQIRSITTIEELWLASEKARAPSLMPFGKHKGVPMAEVPADYKRWLLGQGDIDPYLRKALEA